MPEVLRLKLDQLRHRVRRMLWTGGVCAFLATVCGLFLLAAGLDWLLVGESLSGRILLSVSVVALTVWIVRRELVRPLSVAISDRWLASKIESHVPRLNGALASLVEFCSQDNPNRLGSIELQQKAIDETMRRVVMVRTESLLDPTAIRWRMGLAAICSLACFIFVVMFPATALAALQRLAFPVGQVDWPRQVQLEIRDREGEVISPAATSILTFPRGSVWELDVVNLNGELPDDLALHQKFDTRVETSDVPRELGGEPPQLLGQLRLPMDRSFAFRITGGDDRDSDWIEVQIVPPPVLQQFSLKARPPDYVGGELQEIPAGANFVELTQGSALLISGEANVPLFNVELHAGDNQTWPLFLGEEATQFEGELSVDFLGPRFLNLVLTDESGVANPNAFRLELIGQADASPKVEFQQPASDLFLTPQAELDVRLIAEDDYGLKDVIFEIVKSSEKSDPHSLLRESLLSEDEDSLRTFEYQNRFTLKALGVEAGDLVTLRAIARDPLSSEEEHFGLDERVLTVLSTTEKEQELAARLHELTDRINRERKNQLLTRDRLIQSLAEGEIDDAIRTQKQIEQRLTDEDDSLREEVERLKTETERNHIDNPVFNQRLDLLTSDFEELDSTLFPALNQFLSRLPEKLPESDSASSFELPSAEALHDPMKLEQFLEPLTESLRSKALSQLALAKQEEIADLLQQMSGDLSDWKEGQSLKDSLTELQTQQREIAKETESLRRQTLGKSLSELSSLERDQLQNLVREQQENRQNLNRFTDELKRQSNAKESSGTLKDLQSFLESSPAGTMMSDSEQAIRENHLGESLQTQRELLNELKEWDDQLNRRPITDAQMKMRILEREKQSLEKLLERQKELREQASSSENRKDESERLARDQEELRQQSSRSERMLNRLQMPNSEQHLHDASRNMSEAGEQLQQGHLPQREFEQAEQNLEQALEQLERTKQELQGEHLAQLLAELLPQLRNLASAQGKALAAGIQLQGKQQRADRWNRPLLRELKDLRESQESLANRTKELIAPLSGLESVPLALGRVERMMRRTVQDLEQKELPIAINSRIPAILSHLKILIDVMERTAMQNLAGNQGLQQGGNTSNSNPEQKSGEELGLQLIVLRAVQEQIHLQMEQLTMREQEEGESPATRDEWKQLQEEQTRVLDLLKEMLRFQNLPVPD